MGQRLQRRKTPRRLAYLKGVPAADRDTGGVIAPVLQAAQSIQPVSYTHLDVYKRQTLSSAPLLTDIMKFLSINYTFFSGLVK